MSKFSSVKSAALAFAIASTMLSTTTTALAHGDEHQGHDGHAHKTASIGVAGDASAVSRTVEVEMSDAMRFTPSNFSVKRGETIRFVVKNSGNVKHEFNLGTEAALKEHYALMLKFPEMEHSDPNVASVEPGKTGEVIWKFTKAGTVSFACLHPGHYEAGMKGVIKVSSK
jgi:uncharacterized cupredoxin-like copper-binding protein